MTITTGINAASSPAAGAVNPLPNIPTTELLSPGARRVLNEHELAERWGMSHKTLQRWRYEGRGPQYLKLSKRVCYPLETILAFEQQSLHQSTSERSSYGDVR